jgi:predicted O-methyltransferase YrrM
VSIFRKITDRRREREVDAGYSAPTAEQEVEFTREDQLYGLGSNQALDGLGLMKALMIYRPRPITRYLGSMGRRYSMLHPDVLVLLYYLARYTEGDILEIGPYIGGSTIAAAQGARDAAHSKTIVTIEHGVPMASSRLSSGDTIADLKQNLASHGVADLVRLIVGEASAKSTIEAVRHHFQPDKVGLFIMDADGAVENALTSYGELLHDDCWVVVDDYFATGVAAGKALRSKTEIDSLVDGGVLYCGGFFGWGTWIGKWRRNRNE